MSSFSRRQWLKTTVLFSSGWAAARAAGAAELLDPPRVGFGDDGIHLLAFGDFGTRNEKQQAVADQMNAFAGRLGMPLTAVLALGDNFYGELQPDHFPARFEEMYSTEHLDCPFYGVLGNHDYGPQYDSGQGRAKAEMELAYTAEHPASRWKMPAKWYAVELGPAGQPLVKVICLDGSYFEGALTPQEKIDQRRWLEAEFARETAAPWLWMVSHYPVAADSVTDREAERGRLLREWEPYLRDPRVSLYLAGHDHNLQHLRLEGYSPELIVSGGGGAGRYELKQEKRGFGLQSRGFNHIHVTRDKFTVQFINPEGERLHAFERNRAGETLILPAGAGAMGVATE